MHSSENRLPMVMHTKSRRTSRPSCGAFAMFAVFLLAFLSGCFEIDTHVMVHEDGSATITEKVRFSKRLLDLDRTREDGVKIASLLSKQAVLERMQQMGEGIELVSHEVHDAALASRESVAVFKIADIGDFQYVSPFFGYADYADNNVLQADIFPVTENVWWGRHSGEMALKFALARKPKQEPQPERKEDDGKEPPSLNIGPSPRELQIYRDLQPVFRDMASGMKLRFTVEVYAPLRVRRGLRNGRAGTRKFDLVDFSSDSMDQYGYDFLGNEEVMLELLRGELNGPNLAATVEDHVNNFTVPIIRPTGAEEIWFRPSKPLFDKYFAGKKITIYRGREKVDVPAEWKNIGYDPNPNEGQKK